MKISRLPLTAAGLLFVSCNLPIHVVEKSDRATSVAAEPMQSARAPEPTPTFLPSTSAGPTTHGRIVRDEVWRGEVHVIGDITVDEGVTLTIEPGTVVRVAANQDIGNLYDEAFNMKIGVKTEANYDNGVHRGEPYRDEGHHISIRINGSLQAVGTPDNMITITSDSPTPGIYDWNYLEFNRGILSYAVVEYYRVMGPNNAAVVSHNILRHIGECGVCANSSALVEFNAISYAGHELIDMHQSSPTIRGNILGPNPDHAGIIIDGGSPQILNNTVMGCGMGLMYISRPGNPHLEGNVFKNNGQDMANGY